MPYSNFPPNFKSWRIILQIVRKFNSISERIISSVLACSAHNWKVDGSSPLKGEVFYNFFLFSLLEYPRNLNMAKILSRQLYCWFFELELFLKGCMEIGNQYWKWYWIFQNHPLFLHIPSDTDSALPFFTIFKQWCNTVP